MTEVPAEVFSDAPTDTLPGVALAPPAADSFSPARAFGPVGCDVDCCDGLPAGAGLLFAGGAVFAEGLRVEEGWLPVS
ncbi:MAG: hypothetical protein ACLPTL_03280 [Steroidobacteraceae bacterium]